MQVLTTAPAVPPFHPLPPTHPIRPPTHPIRPPTHPPHPPPPTHPPGKYSLPWDMDLSHRQFNPLFVLSRAVNFISEAQETLRRRWVNAGPARGAQRGAAQRYRAPWARLPPPAQPWSHGVADNLPSLHRTLPPMCTLLLQGCGRERPHLAQDAPAARLLLRGARLFLLLLLLFLFLFKRTLLRGGWVACNGR